MVDVSFIARQGALQSNPVISFMAYSYNFAQPLLNKGSPVQIQNHELYPEKFEKPQLVARSQEKPLMTKFESV